MLEEPSVRMEASCWAWTSVVWIRRYWQMSKEVDWKWIDRSRFRQFTPNVLSKSVQALSCERPKTTQRTMFLSFEYNNFIQTRHQLWAASQFSHYTLRKSFPLTEKRVRIGSLLYICSFVLSTRQILTMLGPSVKVHLAVLVVSLLLLQRLFCHRWCSFKYWPTFQEPLAMYLFYFIYYLCRWWYKK
jgi:hypothetical protein